VLRKHHKNFTQSTASRTLSNLPLGPAFGLTVEFGSDGLACQELLEPLQPLLHGVAQASLMSSDVVTEVLEEIAPADIRGRDTGKSSTMSGCNQVEIVNSQLCSFESEPGYTGHSYL
jgi:hypothetical protein